MKVHNNYLDKSKTAKKWAQEGFLPKKGEEFCLILVPRKDQLQPQEALDRAVRAAA